jgi:hypothetical protein
LALGEFAIDLMPAECLQPEPITEQPARGGGDQHRARLGQGLQSPTHRLLLCGAFADQVADHDDPGGDPDPHLIHRDRRRGCWL